MKSITTLLHQYGAELAALLVVTIWGTNFVFQKAILAEFSPLSYTFLRYSGMLVLGWLIFYVHRRMKAKDSSEVAAKAARKGFIRADLWKIILSGVLGYTLYIPLSTFGLNYTTAFSGALLIATAPLFTALLLLAFKLERIRPGQWLAIGLALFGVMIFLLDKLQIGIQSASLGDLLSLVAAFFFAAYSVVNKSMLRRYSAPALTAYTMTCGALPVLLFSIPAVIAQDWSRVSLAGWSALVWSSIFPVYFAWTVWSWASARAGVARTSVFMYLVPMIGGITSWWLLGEDFGPFKLLGGLIILLSLGLMRWQATRQASVTPPLVKAVAVDS